MNGMNDVDFLREAIRQATASVAIGGGPFGAVIVRDGTVIAEGHNAVSVSNDPTAHAEIVAIREACRELAAFTLTGCTLYASCEPCPMCLAAAYWARVERIVFAATRDNAADAGFDDAFLYREVTLPLSDRALPTTHLASEDALTPFQAWAARPDKVAY